MQLKGPGECNNIKCDDNNIILRIRHNTYIILCSTCVFSQKPREWFLMFCLVVNRNQPTKLIFQYKNDYLNFFLFASDGNFSKYYYFFEFCDFSS